MRDANPACTSWCTRNGQDKAHDPTGPVEMSRMEGWLDLSGIAWRDGVAPEDLPKVTDLLYRTGHGYAAIGDLLKIPHEKAFRVLTTGWNSAR